MDKKANKNYVIAKDSDGTIQITFTIDKKVISERQNTVLLELGKDTEVPGFRKGNAPPDKVKEHVSREKLIEKILSGILPKMFSDALISEKIKPSIFPKFELISSTEDENWQVRAITCEITPFDLNDYKTNIKGLFSKDKIWTPQKGADAKETKEPTRLEKEQKIIEVLLRDYHPIVPKILIDEEVNSRLSQLLSRIEKLGLTLEGYLSSIGKDPQTIRQEYAKQSEDAIKIELILEKVAIDEKITTSQSEIDEAIKASSGDPAVSENINSPEQTNLIKTIIMRRKALDFLLNLL